MAAIVAEFFNVIGIDQTAPSSMGELIPWLITIVIGVWLVSLVFGLFKEIMFALIDWRRYR